MNLLCSITNFFAYYLSVFSLILFVAFALFLVWYWKIRKYKGDPEQYFVFKDEKFKEKWSGKKVPISYLHEAYFAGEIDLKDGLDLLEVLEKRREYSTFTITPEHVKFFFKNVVPEFFIHSKSQDRAQIADHYNRGNDFFEWFLGPSMVYTSGIWSGGDDQTLEDAQDRKMKYICEGLNLKKGEKHLDIGCGWGTLIRYAAKNYETESTGVSLSSQQADWHKKKCEEEKVDTAKFLCMDYREIPNKKFDKISCVEMSEHVGIVKYQKFMKQVYNLLDDDGLFYLQIAGLRMTSHKEDYTWGFFMDKYIFPGADASLPLTFPVQALERGGFEIQSIKTIGIHYSLTINKWYDNWMSNKDKVMNNKKYGKKWFRLWEWFLAWSTIIARQGNSTCYMIIAHKNRDEFNRRQFLKK